MENSTIQRRKNAIVVIQGFVGSEASRKFKTIVRGMVLTIKTNGERKKHYAIKVLAASKIQLMFMSRLYRKQYLYLRSAAVLIQSLEAQIRATLEKYVLQKDPCNPIILALCCVENHTSIFEGSLQRSCENSDFYKLSASTSIANIGNIQRLQRLWRRKSGTQLRMDDDCV